MKIHTPQFKEKIKQFGREIDSIITYTIDDNEIELSSEELNSVTPIFEGNLLKSVMKELNIDSNVDIPIGTVLTYQFGVKTDNEYEYIDFGNYVVYSSEKQEDLRSYKIVCYDSMLYTMKNYEKLQNGIFPMEIRDFISNICLDLGLEFKNKNETFANFEKVIKNDVYENLGYTYRDVLDELAQVTASTICINRDNELEIRYINETNDIIDEEYLKDINVNFGEKVGPINSIVLSRAGEADNIYMQNEESIEQNGLSEIKIKENQIMNFNDRSDYLQDILDALDGTEYYVNDFASTGICYYDLCDMYTIKVDEKEYNCLMLNDEIEITQGLVENIHTDLLEESVTDYTKADTTDRRINQAYIIVDKQQLQIDSLTKEIYEEDGIVNQNFTQINQNINNITTNIQHAGGTNLLKNSVMFAYDNEGIPESWDVDIAPIQYNGNNLYYDDNSIVYGGVEGLVIQSDVESTNAGCISGNSFTLNNKNVIQKINVKANNLDLPEEQRTYYTFSTRIKKGNNGNCYVKIFNENDEYIIELKSGESSYYGNYEITKILPTMNYFIIEFYGSDGSNATFTDNMFTIGEYAKQWTQANGEIMNTQVNFSTEGILVKSSIYEGDYTVMSPLEFAGYSNINGILTKIFTLNKDVTEVTKLESDKEIKMNPIKIIPITEGEKTGWAFVPSSNGGVN